MGRFTTPQARQDAKAMESIGRKRSARPPVGGASDAAAEAQVEGEAPLARMVCSVRESLGRTGLDQGQTQQVGARLSASLVLEAKKRTGLSSNTDLLTFALANVAIEDTFADAFERAHGTLDPDLDIGF